MRAASIRWSFCAIVLATAGANAYAGGGDPAAGQEKSKVCVACHGEDGNSPLGQTPQPPRLAGQYADYLVKALEDYATKARNNALMSALVAQLSAEDREDIAAFYASQRGGVSVIEHTE